MKKSLLLASFAIFATVASAQTTACLATSESLEAAGLSGTKTDIPAETVIFENTVGKVALAFADSWGTTTTYKGYQDVKVGDLDIKLGSGAVGNTNPTFVSYADGAQSAGAVFALTPAKDGWATVFTKINPKKQYVVVEGKSGALAYTLGFSNGTDKIYYTTPHDEDFMINFSEEPEKYFVSVGDTPDACKPQFPYLVAGMEEAPGESTGFLTFNVLGGSTYYFSALGSKAACAGFVLTEGEAEPAVTFAATDELPEVVFGTGGAVESVAVAADENAPIYNMMGVRVSDDAKGILIQNGKKFIRK